MLQKGIVRGDMTFRHFEFDDELIVIRGTDKYYKANYGKNKLEGEYAEDEIAYVPCEKVMVIGSKKKPVAEVTEVQKPEPVEEPVKEVKKKKAEEKPVQKRTKKTETTRTKKTEIKTVKQEPVMNIPVSTSDERFEYMVKDFDFSDSLDELVLMLNEFGNDRWEMCGFSTDKQMFSKSSHIFMVFKRKRD